MVLHSIGNYAILQVTLITMQGEYIPRKNFYWQTANKKGKTAEIKEAMDRKERSIQRFVDAKSLSIAVSSAFNSASDLCNTLVASGGVPNPLTDSKGYWEAHSKLYEELLNGFLDAQEEAAEWQRGLKEAPKVVSHAREKALEDARQDMKEGGLLLN